MLDKIAIEVDQKKWEGHSGAVVGGEKVESECRRKGI